MRAGNRRIWEGKACVLCGGARPAENVEHAPPKSIFHGKIRPEGYAFASCKRCNNGSGHLDALAAFVCMSGRNEILFGGCKPSTHEINLARSVARAFPKIYKRMTSTPISTPVGLITGHATKLELTEKTSQNFAKWSAKQAYAYWSEENKACLSAEAVVGIVMLTNDRKADKFPNEMAKLLGSGRTMTHGKKSFGSQFFYRYSRNPEQGITLIQAVYHESTGFFALIDELNKHPELQSKIPFRFKTSNAMGIHMIYPKSRSRLLFG
ncbi:hypothetical protein GVY41_07560 [Frigidibacter albus]|uniref:hypothetical protein n=1 Tax=Frigidibacter albus TaxID=1465486 RepID=UPI0016B82D6A|nr:hypothetical protein [Frigidibacter albus]NBE30852.1 hypothetical protein [Frigidibacter albus]